jgi:hypothetical protein
MAERKITAIIIVEVAGRPSDYVLGGLETHVSRLNEMKDIEVIKKTFSEPKRIEHQEEAYVCFAEIEIRVNSFQKLLDLVFDFMPSSIEITEPGRLEMDSQEATMFVNNLAGRLHRYDEIAKIAQFKIKQLTDELTSIKNQKNLTENLSSEQNKGKTNKSKKKIKS